MSWNRGDWGNFFLSPGVMQGAQGLMGMMGGQQQVSPTMGGDTGSGMDGLLAQLFMQNQNQQRQSQQSPYIGGQGLI